MGILLEPRRNAARGARRLDEIEPEWFRRVDVMSLDMPDGRHSVLGQVGLAIDALDEWSRRRSQFDHDPVYHGFKIDEAQETSDAEVAVRWAALHYAWLREVWKRL
jgi:hypothetical protein